VINQINIFKISNLALGARCGHNLTKWFRSCDKYEQETGTGRYAFKNPERINPTARTAYLSTRGRYE
jgi:hypothetical protein